MIYHIFKMLFVLYDNIFITNRALEMQQRTICPRCSKAPHRQQYHNQIQPCMLSVMYGILAYICFFLLLMIIISVMIQNTINAETIVHFQKSILYFLRQSCPPMSNDYMEDKCKLSENIVVFWFHRRQSNGRQIGRFAASFSCKSSPCKFFPMLILLGVTALHNISNI